MRSGGEKAAIDTAAKMLDALSPSDAAGALGLPGGGIELTRDHAAVAAVIRTMTGTMPTPDWEHAMSWEEALAFERQDLQTMAQVVERGVSKAPQAEELPHAGNMSAGPCDAGEGDAAARARARRTLSLRTSADCSIAWRP